MTTDNQISLELQAKIDALPDEKLKSNILRRLNRPWKRTKSNEQICEEMMNNHEEVMAKRAKWRKWRDDKALYFFEHFKHAIFYGYAEYLRHGLSNMPLHMLIKLEISTEDERSTLAISKQEILSFLHAIESGEIVLTPLKEPQWVYAGVVGYEASNGWRIAVFNDANEWDYIECIIASDGRRVDYFEMQDKDSDLVHYAPSNDVAWRCYGIPGYLQNRCKQCGSSINADPGGIYLCQECIC